MVVLVIFKTFNKILFDNFFSVRQQVRFIFSRRTYVDTLILTFDFEIKFGFFGEVGLIHSHSDNNNCDDD